MPIDGIVERPASLSRAYTRPAAFRRAHRLDHDFFVLMVALIWVGIAMGFGSELLLRARLHAPPFPMIVDIHAVVFVTWLCVLTAQVLLVRSGRTDLHRRLGKAGIYLYVAVAVLGPATAFVVNRMELAIPQANPGFIAIQFADMLSFTVLGGAALLLRRVPQAHKRLLLLAVIFISDAGFSRWWALGLHNLLGAGARPLLDGFWVNYLELYLGDALLVGLLGLYDWITRRRLHPVYVLGAVFGLGLQLIATALFTNPWWKSAVTVLLRL